MIGVLKKEEFPQIISLWHEIFGDDEAIIEGFLKIFSDCVVVYREGKEVLGMLTLLPISVKSRLGYYVYAVATAMEHRGKGVATKLIEYAKKICDNKRFLILSPATVSLEGFYEKLGFLKINCFSKKQVPPDLTSERILPVIPITSTELFILRKEYFKNNSFFEWDIDVLDLMHNCFKSKFLKIGKNESFAVCDIFENFVLIKELCLNDNVDVLLASIKNYFGKEIAYYTVYETDGKDGAMVWGGKFYRPYFNLALD